MNDVALPPISRTFRYRPLLSTVLLIVLALLILAARSGPGKRVSEAAALGAGQPVQAVALSIAP